MSKKLILGLNEIVGDSISRNLDLGILLLQLVAWEKLSNNGECNNKFSSIKAETLEKYDIQKALSSLYEEEKLDINKNAFLPDEKLFYEINAASLKDTVNLIQAASESKVINYAESIETIIDLASRSEGSYSFIPNEVADLMTKLAQPLKSETVYCPFAAPYKLALYAKRYTKNIFIEVKKESPLPYLMNILDDGELKVKFSDPIKQPSWIENGKLKSFDISLANLPFGVRYKREVISDLFDRFPEKTFYGEVLLIRHILAHTSKRAVVIVPENILYRTSAGERDFKADIIKKGILEAVIALPPSLLTTTSLKFSLMVFNKEIKSDKIFFIDASSKEFFTKKRGRGSLDTGRNTLKDINKIIELYQSKENTSYSSLQHKSECEKNEFNLLAERYVLSDEQLNIKNRLENFKTIELGNIAELIRPQAVKTKKQSRGTSFHEVSIRDIPVNGFITEPNNIVKVTDKYVARAQRQLLRPYDILVSTRGTIGVVGITPKKIEQNWLASQAFQIIRLKADTEIIDPIVLYMYFRSEICQLDLRSRAAGMFNTVKTQDIKKLPIVILSVNKQKKVIEAFKQEQEMQTQVNNLKAEMKNVRNLHWQ